MELLFSKSFGVKIFQFSVYECTIFFPADYFAYEYESILEDISPKFRLNGVSACVIANSFFVLTYLLPFLALRGYTGGVGES